MRITTKGQVTIPREGREKMGFLPHSEVEFVVEGNLAYLRKEEGAKSKGKKLSVVRFGLCILVFWHETTVLHPPPAPPIKGRGALYSLSPGGRGSGRGGMRRQQEVNGQCWKKLVDRMRGRATVRMSTDEIMALTRGED
jgi:hypothetical protein